MQVFGYFVAEDSLAKGTHARARHELLGHCFGKRKSGMRNENSRGKVTCALRVTQKKADALLKHLFGGASTFLSL
jgi:hypothetical protein